MGSREEEWISLQQRTVSPGPSHPAVFPYPCPRAALGSSFHGTELWEWQRLRVEIISAASLKIKQKLVYDNRFRRRRKAELNSQGTF